MGGLGANHEAGRGEGFDNEKLEPAGQGPEAELRFRDRVAAILWRKGAIDDLSVAQDLHDGHSEDPYRRFAGVNQSTVCTAIAESLGVLSVDLKRSPPQYAITSEMPREIAERYGVVPLRISPNKLVLAVTNAAAMFHRDELAFMFNREIEFKIAPPDAFTEAFRSLYDRARKGEVRLLGVRDDDLRSPIPRVVNQIIGDAIERRASDIFIEPFDRGVRVRYRVDGVAYEVGRYDGQLGPPIVSRLKVAAEMDIAEKRQPLDGRLRVTLDGKPVDIRIATLPTAHGEEVTLRILDHSANLLRLSALGMDRSAYEWFQKTTHLPHGMVLVTGPTGSGKTTTLYAALQERNVPGVRILTAEEPVEYEIPGISQVQVKPEIDLTFPRILRSMLRASPDIILVGEIRDRETAEVALQGSLTGHLVFSTLHTNDAIGSITRLLDLGAPSYLVSSALHAVVAQRLVRVLCNQCAEEYRPSEEERRYLHMDAPEHEDLTLKRCCSGGCAFCHGTGYTGRIAIFERLTVNAEMQDLVRRNVGKTELERTAEEQGLLHSLFEDGVRKVLQRRTSVAELRRVLGG